MSASRVSSLCNGPEPLAWYWSMLFYIRNWMVRDEGIFYRHENTMCFESYLTVLAECEWFRAVLYPSTDSFNLEEDNKAPLVSGENETTWEQYFQPILKSAELWTVEWRIWSIRSKAKSQIPKPKPAQNQHELSDTEEKTNFLEIYSIIILLPASLMGGTSSLSFLQYVDLSYWAIFATLSISVFLSFFLLILLLFLYLSTISNSCIKNARIPCTRSLNHNAKESGIWGVGPSMTMVRHTPASCISYRPCSLNWSADKRLETISLSGEYILLNCVLLCFMCRLCYYCEWSKYNRYPPERGRLSYPGSTVTLLLERFFPARYAQEQQHLSYQRHQQHRNTTTEQRSCLRIFRSRRYAIAHGAWAKSASNDSKEIDLTRLSNGFLCCGIRNGIGNGTEVELQRPWTAVGCSRPGDLEVKGSFGIVPREVSTVQVCDAVII